MTFLGLTDALAHTQIQRQVDPETGITTYSFNPFPAQRREKPVPPPVPRVVPDPMPLPRTAPMTPLMTAPAPAPPPPPAPSAPAPQQTQQQTETRTAPPIRLTPSSYRDFPRVSADTQRERDSERRRILKQELAWEEEKLVQAIESKAAGDVVQRFRTNIEALQREIRNAQ